MSPGTGKPVDPSQLLEPLGSGRALNTETNQQLINHPKFIISTVINDISGDNRPHAKISVKHIQIVGLLDSGANCSILGSDSFSLIKQLNLPTKPFDLVLKTADGTKHSSSCIVDLPITFLNKTAILPTLVVPTLTKKLILGMDFWTLFDIKPVCGLIDMELLPEDHIDLTPLENVLLKEAIATFQSSVPNAPLSCTHLTEHHINTGDSPPIKQRYYPVSPYVQAEMDQELERMLALGVIEKSSSSWSNPLVGVRKPNGKLRLCLDSRKLNAVTKTDAFPLPYISRILGRLKGTKFLSSIDLSDAFWQIPLSVNDKDKTAFTVPGRGLFQFKRLPFGLHGAAQSLCRLMDAVLGYDLEPSVFVYLDDIVIATDTFDEHIRLVKEVARRLKSANLSISLAKSKFCLRQINYLGYIINQGGINVNPDKVSAIVNYPSPRNVRDVRRLLGMATWYSRFIPNFASVSAPITELLKKSRNKFVWTEDAESALNVLKTALVSAPVLATPDFSQPFMIYCDASDVGVGAVLVQGTGTNERAITYMSQKLSGAQTKYTTTEKECLSVILAIEKFRPYIEGVKFTVFTDHASLLWLTNLKDPTGRLARWALRLQQYDFILLHRKGKLNVVPDALSRSVEMVIAEIVGDQWYEDLKNKIINDPGNMAGYQLVDDTVYKYVRDIGSEERSWKVVVPFALRDNILKKCHDDPTASHGGIKKTIFRIKSGYYWPSMTKEIKAYVKKCELCQTCKPVNFVMRNEMGQPKDPEQPWKMLSVDLVGPLPRSKTGNSFLLVVLDVFSKFVLLKPLKSATAKTVTQFIEEQVFLVFGVPKTLICDNGSQFIAKSFKSFLAEYDVRLWYTASYLPQANPVERVNKSIKSALRTYAHTIHREWDKYTHHIGCALRTAIHGSINCTPYYANFGQEMVVHGKDHITGERLALINNKDPSDRLILLDKVRSEISANLKRAYDEYSNRYNLRSRKVEFQVGETVLKKNFILSDAAKGVSASLNAIFVKAIVVKKLGNSCYRLKSMAGKDIGVFSVKDLKKFY